jgi:DeoR family transcriptional regulator of aga operon
MHRADRLAAILDEVAQHGSVDVKRAAVSLDVSQATLRRDLRALDQQGLLARTHGGAVAGDVGFELPLRYREAHHHPQKRRIGRAAAELIADGTVVGMTAGTTVTEVARALRHNTDVTVVTNALNIATELVLRPSLRVVVAGGTARNASYALVGPAADTAIDGFHLDMAFVGVDGLTVAEGATAHDEMEAHTDHSFLLRARRAVVVADSSKLGRVAFARICRTQEIHDVVTDDGADPKVVRALRAAGVRVLVARVPA